MSAFRPYLDAHVISQTLYMILIVTALFTPFMAVPVLSMASPARRSLVPLRHPEI